LGLPLKDNAHLQNEAVSSLPSLSSKTPIVGLAPTIDRVVVNGFALELKADGPLPSVEKKLRVLDCFYSNFRVV